MCYTTCPGQIRLVCVPCEGREVHPSESEGGDRRVTRGDHDRCWVHVCGYAWAHVHVCDRAVNGNVSASEMS